MISMSEEEIQSGKEASRPPWTPFQQAGFVSSTPPDTPAGTLYANSRYLVVKRVFEMEGRAEMVWLSIRNRDGSSLRDWREYQRIKNELVDPEWEGVEVYPAESRLVDTTDTFHLWVFPKPLFTPPLSFQQRQVSEGTDQRPLEADTLP